MSALKNNLAAVIDPSFAGNQHLCDFLALLVLNVMQWMHSTWRCICYAQCECEMILFICSLFHIKCSHVITRYRTTS